MRKVLLSLATAAAVVATPAFAAAEPGPYVGVGVTDDNINGTGTAQGIGFDGIGGTAVAGYNLPVGGKAFAGLEGNFEISSADAGTVKADYAFGASARLGYHISDGAALYGKVGYQRGRLTLDRGLATQYHESRDGLQLGGGIEANLTGKTSVRVEYDHTHYYRTDTDPVDSGLANNQAKVAVLFGF